MRVSRTNLDFFFEEGQGFDVRSGLTFSDDTKVRLDPVDRKLKLKLQSDARYPTDVDLSVRTRTFEPQALRKILMMQLFGTTPTGTSVGLRLYDGTDELWWDGAAWSAAGAGEWNTEAEVNQNVQTLDVSARKVGVVFNLLTTDDRYTPEVEMVRLMWEGPVDWLDDLLIDSLVGTLQDELSYVGDAALPPVGSSTSSVDLDDYLTNSNLNVVGVDAVFDDVADPDHLTDLLDSYDTGTNVVTLTSPIPTSGRPFLRLLIAPEVSWSTHQDFEEVGKLPSVVLSDTRTASSSNYPGWAKSGTVRKETGDAWSVEAPKRMTFLMSAELRTDRTREQQRLQEAFLRLFEEGPSTEEGPFLRSAATDRRYRLWMVDEFRNDTPPENGADLNVHRVEFRIENAAIQLRAAEQTYGVTGLNLGFNRIDWLQERAAEAADAPVPKTPTENFEVTE